MRQMEIATWRKQIAMRRNRTATRQNEKTMRRSEKAAWQNGKAIRPIKYDLLYFVIFFLFHVELVIVQL